MRIAYRILVEKAESNKLQKDRLKFGLEDTIEMDHK
jgi:hypothetical protein